MTDATEKAEPCNYCQQVPEEVEEACYTNCLEPCPLAELHYMPIVKWNQIQQAILAMRRKDFEAGRENFGVYDGRCRLELEPYDYHYNDFDAYLKASKEKTMSYSTKILTGYAPFKKGTDEIAWDYHFNRAGSNGNDNGVFLIFDDDNQHDAELSLERYDKSMCADFEMRAVEIRLRDRGKASREGE